MDQVKIQSFIDVFSLVDAEVVEKLKCLLNALDFDKIKLIMDFIDIKEGVLNLKIDLKVKNE